MPALAGGAFFNARLLDAALSLWDGAGRAGLPPAVLRVLGGMEVRAKPRGGVAVDVPLRDLPALVEVFAAGRYQHAALAWDSIHRVVDCGANIGEFSTWMAVRTAAGIVAVELDRAAFTTLRRNAARVGPRLRPMRLAVSDGDGADALTLEALLARVGFDGVDVLRLNQGATGMAAITTAPDTLLEVIGTVLVELPADPSPGATAGVVGRLGACGMRVETLARPRGSIIVGWRA